MKIVRRLTQNWKPKLVCLLLACGVWWIIKQNVDSSSTPSSWQLSTKPDTSLKP